LQYKQYITSIQLEQFSLPKNTLQNLTKTLVVDDCLKALQVVKLTYSGKTLHVYHWYIGF